MFKQRDKNKKIYLIALSLTLVIHGLLMLKSIEFNKSMSYDFKDKDPKKMEITFRPESSEDKTIEQIVQTELAEEKKPQEEHFLGQKDQSFDEQTVAESTGSFQEAGKGVRDAQDQKQSMVMGQEESKAQTSQSKEGKTKKKEVSWESLSQASDVDEPEKFKEQASSALAQVEGLESGNEEHSGLASNNDFVEEVPLGDLTNLNTVEYKYYSFYHRIRQQLEQYWGSTLHEKAQQLFARGGRLPSSQNIVTSLEIVLDDNGHIIEIQVQTPSGVREFDEAAIESFGKAGPFPNPPKGMIKGGKARIQWGFVIRG